MNEPAEEILYRRVNLLNSLMIAGWLILLLVLAVVSILGYGQVRQMNSRMAELDRQVQFLTEARTGRGDEGPLAGGPAVADAGDRAAPRQTDPPGTDTAAAGHPPAAPTTAPQAPTPTVAGAGNGAAPPYDVSPVAGLPTEDPDRPGGLAGLFHDLQVGAEPDPDSPMWLMITRPVSVRDALDELRKIQPADAAKQGIPPTSRVRAAQLFLQITDHQQAHRWAAPVTAETSEDGRAWLVAGLASMGLGQLPRAIAELTRAGEKLTDRPEPLKALAEAYAESGQTAKAVEACRAASNIAPGDLTIVSRLSELLIRDGRIDEAITRLRAILAEDPTRSPERARLARLLVVKNRHEEALEVLDEAPQGAPDDVRLRVARGQALLGAGQLPAAEEALNQAVAAFPLSAEAWHFLGLVRLQQRKNPEAIAALERAIAIDSTMPASWEYLGVALANDRRLDEAIARLEEAVRLNVASAHTHYILAMLFVLKRQPDAGLAALKEAVRLDPAYLERARGEPTFSSLPADNVISKHLQETQLQPGPGL